jgi:uncharacterized membrane protein YfcA
LSVVALAALALATSMVGALGGIGGAVLLVPLLVALGVDPAEAAPLGLVSVAAGSLAAGEPQLGSGLVHHRLGVTLESVGSAATVAAALVSSSLPVAVLQWVLALAALAGAVASFGRKTTRNLPSAAFAYEVHGEWPGTLGGVYPGPGGPVPYQARRVPLGLSLMAVGGTVAGLTGVGGGFLKTPVMSEVMYVPVKVAAATTTFMSGITAAAGLAVFSRQGRADAVDLAAIVLGALAGGRIGSHFQARLAPIVVRRVLAAVLVVVAVIVVAR